MAINWKVTKTNPEQGNVEVLWWDDASGVEIGPLNIEMPVENGEYPQGEALKRLIDSYTPVDEFGRRNAVHEARQTARMAHIDAMIGVPQRVDLSALTPAPVVRDQVSQIISVRIR